MDRRTLTQAALCGHWLLLAVLGLGGQLIACSDTGDSTALPREADGGGEAGSSATLDGSHAGDTGATETGADASHAAGQDGATDSNSPVDSGPLVDSVSRDAADGALADAGVDGADAARAETGTDGAAANGSHPDATVTPDAGGILDATRDVDRDAAADATGGTLDAPADADASGTLADGGGEAAAPCVNSTTGSAGFTQGEGVDGKGSPTCNQTELAFYAHSQACLDCMLNASVLHDINLDPGPDCDDLTGTVTTGPAAGTSNVATCLALLKCAIASSCYGNNVADCLCGYQASAGMCNAGPGDTSAVGVCKAQDEAAIGTTDPIYFNKHLTDLAATNNTTAAPNGGSVANTLLNTARTACANICF